MWNQLPSHGCSGVRRDWNSTQDISCLLCMQRLTVDMSFKPLPPVRSMSGAGISDDSSSTKSTSTASTKKDPSKWMWCETQWTNLSLQAKNLGLSKLPYFDPETMILSKEVNARLWKQLVSHKIFGHGLHKVLMSPTQVKLYSHLGREQAPYASPLLIDIGPKKPPELTWYSL